MTTLESSLAFDYDGFLMTETSWSGEVAGSVAWVYDGDFRLASEQVGGGPAVAFQYDADDLPVAVGELTIARDPATGFIAGTALGAVTTERTYTAFGELESLEARLGGAVLYRLELERDAAGRIVAEVETLGPESHARAFGYDLDGRLETVERDGLPWATYAYDPNGNRLSAQGILGDVTADYDEQDRLLCHGDTTYAYLPSGELSSKSQGGQAVHFDYDVFGALQGVTLTDGRELAYVVDPAGRRVGKKVEGQLVQGFLYTDALKPIAELDGAGNLVARFVYGTSPLVPDYLLKGGRTYRILADARSSPRLVVDVESGEIAQRLDYGPFGRVLFDSNPGFQPFGFAGGLYDPQTGLLRFGARDYDPEVGRWTAKDPILFAGGDSNLYAYVLNDPVNLVDPTGEIVPLIVAGGTIGALIGGGIYSVSTWVRGDDFDWKSLAAASAAGAIAGGLGVVATPIAGAAGLGTGVAGTALVNAGIGIVSAAVGAGIDPCQDVTIKYLSSSAAFGVTGGAVGSRIFPPRGMSRFGQVGFPRTWPGVVPRSLGGNAGTNARRAIYRGGTTSVFIGAVGPTYVQ